MARALARWSGGNRLAVNFTKPSCGIERDVRNATMQLTSTDPEDLAIDARRRRRILWIVVSMLVAAGVLGSIAYGPWRKRSLHRASRAAIEHGDYRGAAYMARRALKIDPEFVPACITLAEAGEHDRDAEAVFWREQVLHLMGESPETLIGLASTALSFGKLSAARSALQRIVEKDRGREDFLVLSGALALEERDYAASARHYESALRLQPEKAEYRLALGKAKSASADYLTREEGRRLLQDLAAHPTLGPTAIRQLVASYEAHREFLAALRHAAQLVALPSHTFSDEVLLLRLMRKTDAPDFAARLAEAQQSAAVHPKNAGALLLWMSMDGLAKEGLDWVQKRVPKLGGLPELRPAIGGCHFALNDWGAVLSVTRMGEWESAEYVRHAYRARAHRERLESSLFRTEWNLAIDSARHQIDTLTLLVQMTSEWKWAEETEQALWEVLSAAPGSRWAVDALQKSCLKRNDTPALRRIALHLVKTDPADENAQNDLALLSLLLDIETERATKIARDLCNKHPDNAAFNSTYAFALYSAGRLLDALHLLEKLPPKDLEVPAIAAYYGIMLAANNSREKASRYLEIGRQGDLLREEKDLVAQAENSILNSK